jgi:enoyl-CoA hydratase
MMNAAMSDTDCRLETMEHGRILVVTLDRAPNNALTPGMLAILADAVERVAESPEIHLAILRGNGAVFSKGYDVGVIRGHASPVEHRHELLMGNDVCSRLCASRKPWIAAIDGPCLGGGLELALACQFRLCQERVRLGLPELAQGLLPGLGGIHRLTRLVGRARALDVIVTGALLTADEALQAGLVHRVLPKAGFFDAVLSFARGILAVDNGLVQEVLRLTELAERLGDQACVLETVESIVRRMGRPA